MDRAHAEKLYAEFDMARADFALRAEAERWDFVEAIHGFTGPVETPTGLLVSMGSTRKNADGRSWIVPFTRKGEGYIFAAREDWQPIVVEVRPKSPARAAASKPPDKIIASTTPAALPESYLTVTPEDLEKREDREKAKRQAQAEANVAETERRRFEREGPRRPPAAPNALHVAVPNAPASEEWGQTPSEKASADRYARRGQPRPEAEKSTATVESDPLHLEASRRAANKGKNPNEQI